MRVLRILTSAVATATVIGGVPAVQAAAVKQPEPTFSATIKEGGKAARSSGGGAAVTQQVPAGAYLAVFGPAGSTATVVVE